MKEQDAIKERSARVAGTLNERSRRAVAASEALALGWGGISAVARATGLSRDVIRAGIRELREAGHRVSHQWVAEALRDLRYSLQGNRKAREGGSHPDRDAQFAHLNVAAEAALAAGEPVISVDTKKKELVGDFTNGGREWQPRGAPEAVRVHDFAIPGLAA